MQFQNISERPITQHGLSGLPTAQARQGTANRMIKDKRYWQAQLQMKMNEITREAEKLSRERQAMDRERSAKRSFEKKVKEATKELTSEFCIQETVIIQTLSLSVLFLGCY